MDPPVLPNELALSLAGKCQRWTYTAYSGEPEVNDTPRNPVVDTRYDTRLDRTITDIQTKIQSQKRVLDDVFPSNSRTYNSYSRNHKMKKRNYKHQFKT